MTARLLTIHRRRLAIAAIPLALAVLVSCGGAQETSTEEADSGLADRSEGKAQPSKPGTTTTDEPAKTIGAQLLTYTATLRLRVDDTDKESVAAERLVTKAGGYVQSQQQLGESNGATATTTFQVPSAEYRTVLKQLGKLGTRLSLTQNTDNVTEAVADVDQRVKSAEASLKRLRTLLKTASDIDDVLAIEEKIGSTQAELESLQARQRALAKQVDYATITVTLTGPRDEQDEQATGFLAGLRAGWHGLLAFLTGVATVFGAVLPFLLIAGPLGLAGWLFWRRHRSTRSRRQAKAEPSV